MVKRRASNSAIALPESGGRPLTALDQAQLELMQAGNGTSVGASAVSSSIKCHVDVRCEVSSGESHRISFELPNAAAANEVDAPSCPALPPPSTLHRAASRGSDQLRLPPSSDARSNCAGADIGRTLRQGGAQLLPREAFDPSSAGQNPPPLPPAALHPTASPHDKTPLAQSGSALAKPLSCAGIPAAARPLGTTRMSSRHAGRSPVGQLLKARALEVQQRGVPVAPGTPATSTGTGTGNGTDSAAPSTACLSAAAVQAVVRV